MFANGFSAELLIELVRAGLVSAHADLGERWPSRLVATTAENRLSILRARVASKLVP
jgi:hypothetical protein